MITPEQLEAERIGSAVRTDFILSSEIVAITYANIATEGLFMQLSVLILVALAITIGVYGFVGLIVKMDDIGLHFAKGQYPLLIQQLGRGMVRAMPPFLVVLGYIGTLAMLWVGAEIIVHGIPWLHHQLEHLEHTLAFNAILKWVVKLTVLILLGLLIGTFIEKGVLLFKRLMKRS